MTEATAADLAHDGVFVQPVSVGKCLVGLSRHSRTSIIFANYWQPSFQYTGMRQLTILYTHTLMTTSMTGFAAHSLNLDHASVNIDLRSVNQRYLELHFRLADEVARRWNRRCAS